MKKIIVFLFVCFCVSDAVRAQDTLYKKDGSFLSGKIMGSYPMHIQLQKAKGASKEIFTIQKTDILKIKYADGSIVIPVIDSLNYFPSPKSIVETKTIKYRNGFPDLPLDIHGNGFYLNNRILRKKNFSKFITSRNDTSLMVLMDKANRERRIQKRLLIPFYVLEGSALWLGFYYTLTSYFDDVGVVGITTDKNAYYASSALTTLALPFILYSIKHSRKKNKYKRESAKLYNYKYFNNEYGSFGK